MKKQLILSLLFFLSIAVYSQEHSPPHIDVTGTAEMEVVPDEKYIAISIHERTEGREVLTVEQQESNLKDALRALGINLNNLELFDANADYIRVKWRKKNVVSRTDYRLKVGDAFMLSKVFEQLDKLNIKDARIVKVSHSNIKAFEKDIRIQAIKDTKDRADYLLAAIGERTGKAMEVKESNSNIRPYEFKLFLTSGHTKVEDYIIRERYRVEDETHSPIPFHEFIKSIGLINKHYYNSKSSAIHNILLPNENSTDHFLNYYLLKELVKLFENEGNTNRFISINSIYELFTQFGFTIKTLRSAILDLIDTDEVLTDIDRKKIPNDFNITITLKGYYYIKELCTRFHYFDLIVQDTPIFDNDSFTDIYSKFPLSNESGKRSLNGRVKCLKAFINYLNLCEENQSKRLKTYFGSFKEHINPNMTKDLKRIEKN